MDALSLPGTARILDVGCGTGEFERMAIQRFPGVTIVGVDATPDMVHLARAKMFGCPGTTFLIGRAGALPFGEGKFDAVVSANALHHMDAPREALREWVRVLRPDGQLIVVDWCRDFWHCRLMHYWGKVFDRTYAGMLRLSEIRKMEEALGLAVEQASCFTAKPFYGMMSVSARKALRAVTSPR